MRAANTAALLSRVGLSDGARGHQVTSRGAPARGGLSYSCVTRGVYLRASCGPQRSLPVLPAGEALEPHPRAYVEHSVTCFARAS